MMKLLACLTLILACASNHLSLPQDLESQWDQFKDAYGKQYGSSNEESYRKSIFAENLELIQRHNNEFLQGLHSYDLAANKFADMTLQEFSRQRNGVIVPENIQPAPEVFTGSNRKDLPAEVDWTKKGVVAPVMNEGSCGASWAFGATAPIEGAHALKTGKLVKVSEQELIDCSGPQGNLGCSGGLMDFAYQFVIEKNGIDTAASYPYTGQSESCKDEPNNRTIGATISKFVHLRSGDESALQEACATFGPVSVAINAQTTSFMFYKSGVYDSKDCSQYKLDHGAAVVGYGMQNGKQYWKVKNSWGTDWGMDGYILMSRNRDNQCGIATMASYPVV